MTTASCSSARRAFTSILLLLTMLPWLAACANEVDNPKPPLILPFSVERQGSQVQTNLRIEEHRAYSFSVRFSFRKNDEADRARVRKLVGGHALDNAGRAVEPGVPTPVALRIFSMKGNDLNPVFQAQADPILTSWGADHFRKMIASVPLEPGNYWVQVESLVAAPDFAGTPTAFGIGYDPKVNPIQNKPTK